MPSTKYDFDRAVAQDRLTAEIQSSTISTALDHMVGDAARVSIWFKAELSQQDVGVLAGIVTAHVAQPLAPPPTPSLLVTQAGSPLLTTDNDGRLVVRTSVANKGKNFKLRAFSFETSTTDVHSVDPRTLLPYGDIAHRMVDAAGDETKDPALCVTDVLDFEPPYSYEVDGGWMDVDDTLVGGRTNQWFIGCVGLPDFAAYGLAIDHVSMVNVEGVSTKSVLSDGKSTIYLPYITYGSPPAPAHTNRLRWIVQHPAGLSKRFQIYVRTYAE